TPPGQVGVPVPGVEVRIEAPDEHGVGEVVARGPNVMAGYTDPAATAQVIDADGWLHTGDLGKFDRKGRLAIVGRVKDVIVTANGENVYPDDLERQLGALADVAELAIVGIAAKAGAGERIGCLAVPTPSVQNGSEPPDERQLRLDRAHKSLRD